MSPSELLALYLFQYSRKHLEIGLFCRGSETVFIVYSWGWVHVSTGSLSGEGGEFILPNRSVRGILLYYENYFTLKLRRVKKLLFRMLLRNDACISAELALSLEYRYYYSFTSSDRQYDNKKTTMLILSGCHTLCRNLQGRGLCRQKGSANIISVDVLVCMDRTEFH